MRKLILQMQLSIDGFVGARDGDLNWIFPDADESYKTWTVNVISQAGAHLMGAATYRDMASYWPTSTEPYAAPMNRIPKIVFSRSLQAPTWAETRVLSGDLATEIARLKAEPGKELLAHGGARFARSLVATGLIDEYRFVVHPVALGNGLQLFSELAKPTRFEVVQTVPFGSGAMAVVLHDKHDQSSQGQS